MATTTTAATLLTSLSLALRASSRHSARTGGGIILIASAIPKIVEVPEDGDRVGYLFIGSSRLRTSRHRRGAAALAAPRLVALFDGDARDEERRDGIRPPQVEERVRAEPDEQCGGEVGAEHVLLAFAPRRRRTELLAHAGLGDGERGAWLPA